MAAGFQLAEFQLGLLLKNERGLWMKNPKSPGCIGHGTTQCSRLPATEEEFQVLIWVPGVFDAKSENAGTGGDCSIQNLRATLSGSK